MDIKEQLLSDWLKAKEDLELAKRKESNLRGRVALAYFESQQNEGTNNVPLANGYSLKLKQNYIRSFVDDLPYADMLAKISSLGIENGEKFVKFKPSLVLSEYRKLDGEKRIAFDTMLEIKPSMPSIELVAPKGAK